MTWRTSKDAPIDGTPIIIWLMSGTLIAGRYGETDGSDGYGIRKGWFTFVPLADSDDYYGEMEFDENDTEYGNFLWIPFPQWEMAEVLGKALVKWHESRLKKAAEEPQGEE